jgi:integrase
MGVSKIMGKDLNRFIRRVGIIDERKVLHSLRHRAASRLRAAKCPPDVRYQLLGHEITTVAEDYGEGFPVPILKEWIDKISW